MIDYAKLVTRLRRKTVAGQPVFNTPLENEAANAIEALAARCAELEANLLHYGAHMVACDFIQDTLKCSCGFEAIRAALADGEKP